MLFSSLSFLFIFLPIVVAVYYLVLRNHRRAQNIFLLIASLFFYAWGEPMFVFIMLLSIVVNWAFALGISSFKTHSLNKKFLLTCAIIFNIAVIFYAKYFVFTLTTINQLGSFNFDIPNILLPIGISFYTFQALSYIIDVYRGEPAQKNILEVGFYISFFPQLVAGPIIRYTTFASQIINRKESWEGFSYGISRFVVGLGKKVLLANTCGLLADRVFGGTDDPTVLLFWLGLIAYTLQIYFDFSGYSDMAIGLARMFGFKFPENFDHPYASKSISEFWRRWHISLGSWFRDYVYFPLGGSRVKSKLRLIFNLLIVWSLTGIWHGANWTFLVWGVLYFMLITSEKLLPKWGEKLSHLRILNHIYTMFFVMMGWVVFRAESLSDALDYYSGLFGLSGYPLFDSTSLVLLQENIIVLVSAFILSMPLAKVITKRFGESRWFTWISIFFLALLFLICTSYIVKGFYNPFIYFNF